MILDQLACNALIRLLEKVDFEEVDFKGTMLNKAGNLNMFNPLNEMCLSKILNSFPQPEAYLVSDGSTTLWSTTERLCCVALLRSRDQPDLRTNVVTIVYSRYLKSFQRLTPSAWWSSRVGHL